MFLFKKDQSFYIKNILYLIYFFCWLSISTSFEDLRIFSNDKLNFIHVLNFVRQFLIILSILFLLNLGAKIFFEKKIIKLSKIYLYFIFLIYLFLQIPGLIISENNIINIGFPISSLCVVLVLMISEFYMDQSEKRKFFYITTLFLTLVFFVTFVPDFVEYLKGRESLYGYYSNNLLFLDKISPRSSGLSRMLLILLLLLNIFLDQKNYLKKYIHTFFSIFIITIIFLLQSRVVIFLAILFLIFNFVIQRNYSLKISITYAAKFFIIPLIISIFITNLPLLIKGYPLLIKGNKDNSPNKLFLSYEKLKEIKIKTRPIEDFSSGRYEDWGEIISKIDKKFIFGFGAQGDRFLINQTASNGILYALVSSGFIGLFFYLYFTLMISFRILKIFFLSEFFDKEKLLVSFLIILIFMRSILESSYAVFGVDFIVLMTCLNYLPEDKGN